MQQTRVFDGGDVLFLNIVVQDGSEAVKAKVEKRLAMFPAPVKVRAARRAGALTTPGMLAQGIGPKLVCKIPQSMKAKGVTIDMEEIFREGPYLIFQLRILHVDPVVLANEVFEGLSDFVQWIVGCVGEGLQRTIEREYLPRRIRGILEHEIPKMLEQKMKQKKMIVETKVLTDSDSQALYFSSKVKELRESETRRQALMRSFRRISSSFSSDGSGSIEGLSPLEELQ